ncbi:MAG: tape measure protein [Lachnospiraceae bacterium]|nr:tape measure protein [Lachnospiraceae bacterium]
MAIGAMLQSWVSDIVKTRGEFQQLEIAFNTMLGSVEKGTQLMSELTQTAASTPFDLTGIANSAKQLLAYGTAAEDVNDTLVMLGNIASGLSLPLNDLVYLYGTTMVQGRLFTQDVRQFMGRGIPLVQELSKQMGKSTEEINEMVTAGKIGFADVQKVLQGLTSEGGMFYGLMEEQSKSLTGQLANLGDEWDMMLNEMGKSSQGVLGGAISLASTLVANYKTVLGVLGGLITLYGTYKVALATIAIQQGKLTGMQKIDNIVLSARAGLFKLNTGYMQAYAAQHGAMTQAQQAYNMQLQQALTLEQQEQVLRSVRLAAIQALLTAEQQQFLSQTNLNTQSAEYLAMCESVLNADQRKALAKQNLTKTSMAYGAAVEKAVAAQQAENAATNQSLVTQARALKTKEAALLTEYRLSQNKIQQTRVQIALAQAEGDAEAVAALKQQQHNQLKQHAIIISDLKAARTQKEAVTQQIANVATQQAALAGTKKAASDALQTTSTTVLSTATTFLTAKLKALWATLIANPFTAIISLVGLVASAFMMFGKKEEEASSMATEFNNSVTESYGRMNLYFGILKTAERGTKEYKDSLEAVNRMCAEYNVQQLETNSTLEQQIDTHDALIEAVERTSAAKISAKYKEEELTKALEEQKKALEKLQEQANSATHKELQEVPTYAGDIYVMSYQAVDVASERIQEANKALWASVQALAIEGSESLKDLTGDAYNKAYNELMDKIMKRVQEVTQASSGEMEAFEDNIKTMVDNTIKSQNQFLANTAQIDAEVRAMLGQPITDNAVQQDLDITKLSLEELHAKADELSGTTVTINFEAYGFESVSAMLTAVNDQIATLQGNLNTENGINAEIKRLKDARATKEIGSAEWTAINNQITALQAKLPKTTSAIKSAHKSATKAAETRADAEKDIAQKLVDLELEVEETRIGLIKDGYEKRKQELENQHKQELARIDKEEQDLADKYKKAGKKMPQSTLDLYDQLRTNENASYEIQQTELVADEISERKKQYEQYYKWVQLYGEQSAQEQFADLMAMGNTYQQFIEKRMAELEAVRTNGNPQEAEAASLALIQFSEQYKAITKVKSAMDLFSESMSKAKDNAKTTGDYLASLATLRDNLQQGKTPLIGEERVEALKKIEEEITKTTEELQRQLLETYQSNAEQRLEVERKYDQEITWLRQHGYEKQAQLAEKAKNKAIAELQATQIQGTAQWQTLFQNAQYLSSSAFDAILEELRKMVQGIKDSNVRSALNEQLNGLQAQVVGSKNPFKLLVDSIKQYEKAADGTIEKKQQFAQMFTAIAGSIDVVKGSFDSIVGALTDMGLAGDEMTQEMLGDISNLMGGAGTLAKGIATMNPMDMIQGGISIITSAISLFDSTSRRIRREMKQHEKQLQLLQRAYAQISWETDNAVGEQYYSSAQKEIDNLKKQQQEYKELARLEQSKKSKDRDDNKVQEYLQNAEDAARQIADLEREITENLVQTNFKDLAGELADAWAECFGNMEDSAESFDEVWNTTIANAVKNSLKLKLIEPVVNQFTEALANHMGAHNNSVTGFNFEYWKRMLKNAGQSFTDGLAGFEEFFRSMGDEMEEASDSLEGQVKGVTEETASMLAGEIVAIRIRQVDMLIVQQDIRSCMDSVDNTLRNAISYLNSISQNTGASSKYLADIKVQLNDLKTTIASDPLRAKGLTS